MDTGLALVLVAAFVAVVFMAEGLYLLWNQNRGPEVQRLKRRIRNLSAGGVSEQRAALLKEAETGVAAKLLSLPRLGQLDRLIEQAGKDFTASRVLLTMGGLGVLGVALVLLLKRPLALALIAGLALAVIPLLWLILERSQRMGKMEAQLPDAIDLMGRALRAGHAFPSALQMVGEESPDPLAEEFRIAHDELNFGLSMDDALRNLAKRLPLDDVRFFVIAVLLQRETGGNLAEVLGNIASLVRSRFKLLGKVRVLSAEGKMSAWILALMPLVLGFAINLMNPKFMSILWTDKMGLNMIYGCLVLYFIGAIWMWRLVKIRV